MTHFNNYIYISLVVFISSIGSSLVYAQSGDIVDTEEGFDLFGTLGQIPEDNIPTQTVEQDTDDTDTEETKQDTPTFKTLDDIEPLIDDTSDIVPAEDEETFDQLLDTGLTGEIADSIEKTQPIKNNLAPVETEKKEPAQALVLPAYVAPQIIEEESPDLEELIEDEELDEETTRIFSQPELKYTPQSPKANAFGYLYPETVKSIVDHGEDQIRCSLLAKENIRRLTGYGTQPGLRRNAQTISTGNAVDLIRQGGSKLRKVTPVELLSIENTIKSLVDSKTSGTIVDLYMRRPNQEGVLQGHRSMAFVGTDNKVYVLDPIIYFKSSKAHHISTYIAKVGAGVQRYIDPTPYRVASKYINSSDKPTVETVTDTAEPNICDNSMYQEILLQDEYLLIDTPNLFEKLFSAGKLGFGQENDDIYTFTVTTNTLIQIQGYPLVSMVKGTKITTHGVDFRDLMKTRLGRDPTLGSLQRGSDKGTIDFDRPIEVIMYDLAIRKGDIMQYTPVLGEQSHTPSPNLVNHYTLGCDENNSGYTYMPISMRDDGLVIIYMCGGGVLELKDEG